MKVSVIIPAYNIEKYIERCLLSITSQTLKDIEIIIVNDGSSDNTLDKVKAMANGDDRIIILNQDSKGSIEARKKGLDIATGEYILFVDGDDWLESNALELLYKNAINHNSDIVIFNAFLSYDDKREELQIFKDLSNDEDDYLKSLFLCKISPSLWSKFIKRDFIKYNSIKFPKNISFAEDLSTVSSLFMHNPKVSTMDDKLYNYYQRDNSITKTKNNSVLQIGSAMSFIKTLLIEKDMYNEYKVYFEYMIYQHIFELWFLENYCDIEDINIKLYQQYSNYNININKNYFIMNKIKNYSTNFRIRIKIYNFSYRYGKLYDKLRFNIKKIINI